MGGTPAGAAGYSGRRRRSGRSTGGPTAQVPPRVAALVVADAPDGIRLFAVTMEQTRRPAVEGTWPAVGMAGSDSLDVTYRRRGSGGRRRREYVDRPGFWYGGMGVAACWYGGAVGVARALAHSAQQRELGRQRSPTSARSMYSLQGRRCSTRRRPPWTPTRPTRRSAPLRAQRLRAFVADLAAEVVDRVGRALGAGPLCHDAAHARRVTDLTVYLRQHHAEKDLEAIGATSPRTARLVTFRPRTSTRCTQRRDPWGFTSRWYEQRKYAVTLAGLPDPRFATGFEPGCSIGVLTALLAVRCDGLLASDGSAAAVAKAWGAAVAPAVGRHRTAAAAGGVAGRTFDLVSCGSCSTTSTIDDLDVAASRDAVDLGRRHPGRRPLAALVDDYPHAGDSVHAVLGSAAVSVGLVRPVPPVEDDFLLDVFTRPGDEETAAPFGRRAGRAGVIEAVGVVVPVHNEELLLPACLASLARCSSCCFGAYSGTGSRRPGPLHGRQCEPGSGRTAPVCSIGRRSTPQTSGVARGRRRRDDPAQ